MGVRLRRAAGTDGRGNENGAMNAIEIADLAYTYPNGARGLRGLSLEIPERDCVALVGPNGAGKSTLILHLNGILKGRGEVRIFGKSVADDVLAARQAVGLVFQNPDDQLFMPTVFEDVAFGPLNLGWPKERVETEVRKALNAVGMLEHSDRAPHHLSLGQKKRCAIATVLVMDCKIMVLDEPTTGLDPRGRWDFLNLLKGLDRTKIIATHDLDLVREMCDTTVILDDGRVAAQGPTAELLDDEALLGKHGLAPPTVRA